MKSRPYIQFNRSFLNARSCIITLASESLETYTLAHLIDEGDKALDELVHLPLLHLLRA